MLKLEQLLNPAAIAVVGASSNAQAIGGQPIAFLLKHGYKGQILPVNPKYGEIFGLRCYPSVEELPDGVDLAIIAVAASRVPDVIRACAPRRIPYAMILSSGFADGGPEGRQQQEELVGLARELGVRILGPNCQGLVNFKRQTYAGFGAIFEYPGSAGPVGMVTQSGGFGGALMHLAQRSGVGFSYFVHVGNAADLSIAEVLHDLIDDPDTRILATYLEGLRDGSNFVAAARRALDAGKPMIVWKAGKTLSGQKAVISHTGSLAGGAERYRSVFQRWGVTEVSDIDEFIDVAKVFSTGRLPHGARVAVVSISGGFAVVCADEADAASHLTLAELSPATTARLREILPSFGSAENPVDVTAQIFNQPNMLQTVIEVIQSDPGVDMIIACNASVHGELGKSVAQTLRKVYETIDTPMVVAWTARAEYNEAAYTTLREAGIPLFESPVRAVRSLNALAHYANAVRRHQAELIDPTIPGLPAQVTTPKLLPERMMEYEAAELLKNYGIQVPTQRLTRAPEEAVAVASEIGYPVALKVQSVDLPHKHAAGGVLLNVTEASAVRAGFERLMNNVRAKQPQAEIAGVLVQKMAAPGTEVIVGFVRDELFGPMLLCGSGGVLTEVVKDSVLRPLPLTAEHAREMVMSLRAHTLLTRSGISDDLVVDVLLKLGRLAADYEGILHEFEINPLIVGPNGAIAVDALAIPSAVPVRT